MSDDDIGKEMDMAASMLEAGMNKTTKGSISAILTSAWAESGLPKEEVLDAFEFFFTNLNLDVGMDITKLLGLGQKENDHEE